jgi:hypothetical protein
MQTSSRDINTSQKQVEDTVREREKGRKLSHAIQEFWNWWSSVKDGLADSLIGKPSNVNMGTCSKELSHRVKLIFHDITFQFTYNGKNGSIHALILNPSSMETYRLTSFMLLFAPKPCSNWTYYACTPPNPVIDKLGGSFQTPAFQVVYSQLMWEIQYDENNVWYDILAWHGPRDTVSVDSFSLEAVEFAYRMILQHVVGTVGLYAYIGPDKPKAIKIYKDKPKSTFPGNIDKLEEEEYSHSDNTDRMFVTCDEFAKLIIHLSETARTGISKSASIHEYGLQMKMCTNMSLKPAVYVFHDTYFSLLINKAQIPTNPNYTAEFVQDLQSRIPSNILTFNQWAQPVDVSHSSLVSTINGYMVDTSKTRAHLNNFAQDYRRKGYQVELKIVLDPHWNHYNRTEDGEQYCDLCERPLAGRKYLKCRKCKSVPYCSGDCLSKDTLRHKMYCKRYRFGTTDKTSYRCNSCFGIAGQQCRCHSVY